MEPIINEDKINVLDHGFVEIVNRPTNGDLIVANSARVSYGKFKSELGDADIKLIRYLVKEKHDSPLRHVQITLRIKAPEFIMRQWYKHIVGCAYTVAREPDTAWNEISGRYIEYKDEFYTPVMFRKQSSVNKQGTLNEPIDDPERALSVYQHAIDTSYSAYKELLTLGVGREVARAVLPLNFYTEVLWTASLQALLNFVSLRDHEGAQLEIQEYARAVRQLLEGIVPHTMAAWNEFRK